MSFIGDFLSSDGGEDAYLEYRRALIRENARERYEREHEFDDLEIDDGYDEYESEDEDDDKRNSIY